MTKSFPESEEIWRDIYEILIEKKPPDNAKKLSEIMRDTGLKRDRCESLLMAQVENGTMGLMWYKHTKYFYPIIERNGEKDADNRG